MNILWLLLSDIGKLDIAKQLSSSNKVTINGYFIIVISVYVLSKSFGLVQQM